MAFGVAAIGLTLDAIQVAGVDARWWTVTAFVVFVVFVTWMIIELTLKNKELENDKPKIEVNAVACNDDSYLEVINKGEQGIFKVRIALVHSKYSTIGYLYDGVWGSTNSNKSEIMKGQSDTVSIATVKITKTEYLFELYAFDTINKIPYAVRSIRYDHLNTNEPKPEFEIEVNISSEPGLNLKEGAFIRRYDVNLSGILPSKMQTRLTTLPIKSAEGSFTDGE